MVAEEYFRINKPDVVYEVIEGEAVIVNLSNGLYYSLDRAGAIIWDFIGDGITTAAIVARLIENYKGDNSEIESAVNSFLDQLQQEHLIVTTANPGASARDEDVASDTADAYKPQFEAPILQRYTDMEELLLLDPIHNVDTEGIPERQTSGA